MSDAREAALDLARRGLRVFPTNSSTLRPLKEGWCEYASDNLDVVGRMFTGALGKSADHNVAILTGDRVVGFDFDCKNNEPGLQTLVELLKQGLPDDTLTVQTPSGGLHKLYTVNAGLQLHGGNKKWPGVDIKAWHGYLNAPGSVKPDGGAYKIVLDRPMAVLPESFVTELSQVRQTDASIGETSDYDDEWSRAAAAEYLKTAELDAGPGTRHDALRKVAHKCFDFGLTVASTVDAIEEFWPIAPAVTEDIAYQVDSHARSQGRKTQWGSAHPNANLAPVTPERYLSLGDCYNEALAEKDDPLVADLLDKGALSEWYGGSNTGKTFILLSLARAIAAGEPWAGKRTSRGLCLYFMLEGGRGVLKRGAALAHGRDDMHDLPIRIIPAPLDLRNGDIGVRQVIADVKAVEKMTGEKCVFLAIDTLSRALAGGNENDSSDMGKLVQAFTAIQTGTGAHVALVHHTGKNEDAGARGHSLLKGAVDTEVFIKRGQREALGTLEITKQRDREFCPDMNFRLEDVWFGPDAEGELRKSAVAVVESGRVEVQDPYAGLGPGERRFLAALERLPGGAGTAEAWGREMDLEQVVEGEPVLTRQREFTLRRALKKKGFVTESGDKWQLKL